MTSQRRRALILGACIVVVGIVASRDFGSRTSDTTESTPPSGARSLPPRRTNADATPPAIPFDPATPRVAVHAVRSWPHDTSAFTEGLVLFAGRLLESTGLEGHSEVRDVDRATGTVRRRVALSAALFGEGIAVVKNRVYQLTWQSGRGYVYDATSLAPLDSFSFSGEGWGLASDGVRLYMSDGSNRIRVVAADGFRPERSIDVTERGQPVWMLNELEWVRGELWANVFQTDFIARIDPATGAVLGWIDLSPLLTPAENRALRARGGVANGIAFDPATGHALVTGKLWPRMFEIDLRSVTNTR